MSQFSTKSQFLWFPSGPPSQPTITDISVQYSTDSQDTEVSVQWNETVWIFAKWMYSLWWFMLQISREKFCVHVVSYTVSVEASNGMLAQTHQVGSNSCANGICSTTFFLPPSNETYRINLIASNMFGLSTRTTFDGVIIKVNHFYV